MFSQGCLAAGCLQVASVSRILIEITAISPVLGVTLNVQVGTCFLKSSKSRFCFMGVSILFLLLVSWIFWMTEGNVRSWYWRLNYVFLPWLTNFLFFLPYFILLCSRLALTIWTKRWCWSPIGHEKSVYLFFWGADVDKLNPDEVSY